MKYKNIFEDYSRKNYLQNLFVPKKFLSKIIKLVYRLSYQIKIF